MKEIHLKRAQTEQSWYLSNSYKSVSQYINLRPSKSSTLNSVCTIKDNDKEQEHIVLVYSLLLPHTHFFKGQLEYFEFKIKVRNRVYIQTPKKKKNEPKQTEP